MKRTLTPEAAIENYIRVLLAQVPPDQEDIITSLCFEHGATGISENLSFIQPDLTFDPILIPKDALQLDVYFETPPGEVFQTELLKIWPAVQIQVLVEENKDWLEEWKKGFTSFPLVRDYWVVPSWLQPPPEARVPLLIDPGMAFGTGTHATTQLAAHILLEAFDLRKAEGRSSRSALDVGTGTGILAMVAAHLGFSHVVANDLDPIARDVARENLQHNHLSRVVIVDHALDAITETFDVVIANIIDGVLIQLRPHLLRVLCSDGHLILSGILLSREEHFRSQFFQDGLKILARHTQDEWVSFLVER